MSNLKYKVVCNMPSEVQEIIDDIIKDFEIVEISINPIVLEGQFENNIVLSGYVSYTEKENDNED